MAPLFGPEGRAALNEVMSGNPLLAFDFDGTLAPIVVDPGAARVPRALARRLVRLSRRWPIAVLTGRRLDDVAPRLGFTPRYLVGNHGAEEAGRPPAALGANSLARLRRLLARHAAPLSAAGVVIEDKGQSLALHYRTAPDQDAALRVIDTVLRRPDPSIRRFGGKCVVNLAPAAAPDKSAALWSLVRRSGASAAVFVGDDVNDEPAFASAAAHWLTVRVGADEAATRARFGLAAQAELVALIDSMLAMPGPPVPAAPPA